MTQQLKLKDGCASMVIFGKQHILLYHHSDVGVQYVLTLRKNNRRLLQYSK
jgi:hypothetical protein